MEAFEKLPKYSLADDLAEMYEDESNLFVKDKVKDFIKWGEKFVRGWTHQFVDELEGLKKGEVEEKLVEMSETVEVDLKINSGECPILPSDSVFPLLAFNLNGVLFSLPSAKT